MLGRPHVTFHGLGHSPRQLVDRVEDVVASNVCKINHSFSDRLVAPLVLLVQQLIFLMIQGQLRPHSGSVDVRDLQKSLHDKSILVSTFHLDFEQTLDDNNPVPRED